MTGHELAHKLLTMPDARVTYYREYLDSGETVEVRECELDADTGLVSLDGDALPDRVYAPDTSPIYGWEVTNEETVGDDGVCTFMYTARRVSYAQVMNNPSDFGEIEWVQRG